MSPSPRERVIWITFWMFVSAGMWAVIIWFGATVIRGLKEVVR